MTNKEIENKLLQFISEQVNFDNVFDIEINGDECWIDLVDGTTMTLTINPTENE